MEKEESPEKTRSQEIHTYAFWLFSVIVGLSVEEALSHVLPHVGELPNLSEKFVAVEFMRLAVFLTLIVRFYLGSVRYFNQAHLSELSSHYPTRNYAIDFFFGLVHFSAFLALSLSIDIKQPTWLFMVWLSFILLYDLIWLLASRKYDTRHLIKLWAFLNGATWIIGALLYFITERVCIWFGAPQDIYLYVSQMVAMLPVLVISLIDMMELFSAKPIFTNWFEKLLRIKPVESAKPEPPQLESTQSAIAIEEKPIEPIPLNELPKSQTTSNKRKQGKKPSNTN